MKIKSKQALQQKANFLFQDLEKEYKPCEALYVLSEVAKILSLVMLQKEQKET
jgi:hypothetical protein